MNQVFHIIKIAAAVICIVAATVCLFVAPNLVLPLAVTGIGWAHIPE